jgi:hypothetical protein
MAPIPRTRLIHESFLQNIYFDTSVWGHLTDAADRDMLVRILEQRGQVPRPSVISVGEILLTPDMNKRKAVCQTVRDLNGTRQVYERPFDIAKSAAIAFRNGSNELTITETRAARSFYEALCTPEHAPVLQVKAWLDNMNIKLEKFIEGIRPPLKDPATRYLRPDVLDRDDFLSCISKFPTAQELGLTVPELRQLCHASDIWRAIEGTLAYVIELSTTHAPRRRKAQGTRTDRPDAADIWQIAYLGCVEAFVSGDVWHLNAAIEISRLLNHPRCIIFDSEFFNGLRKFASGKPFRHGICPVCGFDLQLSRGTHAVLKRA